MTAFADLVLPDTTYLERHDVMSMLDRPISEFEGRWIRSASRWCRLRRMQAVPGSVDRARRATQVSGVRTHRCDGQTRRKFRNYPDFIVNYETEAGSGIGFLAGWRGKGGEKFMVGEPNPKPVGDVRAEQLRIRASAASRRTIHAQLEPGIP
jgi:hypothetical protein